MYLFSCCWDHSSDGATVLLMIGLSTVNVGKTRPIRTTEARLRIGPTACDCETG